MIRASSTKSPFRTLTLTCILGGFLTGLPSFGAAVTNWHTFKATATTLSGQGTSSPILGRMTNTASAAFLIGYFPPVSLTNLGDRITFFFETSFTDAAGMVNAQDNFRFALFDLNGQLAVAAENTGTAGVDGQTDNWRGYWFGVRHPSGIGSIRERVAALNSGDNPFSATGTNTITAPSLGNVGGDGVNFESSTIDQGGPLYVGVMALEKTPAGVALAGYFGGNGATNLFGANDDTTPWPGSYGAVGYLNGGPLNCDQVNFQNVSVSYSFSNALQISSQPVSISVLAGQPAQFNVALSGSGLLPFFQWRVNGTDITDATNSTYNILLTDTNLNGNTYSVVVSNVFGNSVTSSNALLTVTNDSVAPLVLSVSSLVSNIFNVVFSEPVDPVTAEQSSSYVLGGNTFSAVTLVAPTNVEVVLDNPVTTDYSVLVQNVQDWSANTVASTNVPGIAHGFKTSAGIGITTGLGFAVNEQLLVFAKGTDIQGVSDQFQYVYKPISGDFDLAVRIESLLNTDPNAKAGLMARLSEFHDERNVMIDATPSHFVFQYRTNAAGSGTIALAAPRPPTAFPNCWVRLVRSGPIFSGYSSTNLGKWDFIGSYNTTADTSGVYPADVLIGLAVTSHTTSQMTKAVFSGFGPAIVSPSLVINRVGNNVELSWPSTGFTLQATPILTPAATWTNVPGSPDTNRVIYSSGNSALFFRLAQ